MTFFHHEETALAIVAVMVAVTAFLFWRVTRKEARRCLRQ